ncbi:SANT and BTB domain regulator of class switch recombination isoform X1 [Penaeus vannamei]|uniref:SANT and BTB domain regulator of class switch recombination isoform X1 n=1 Tax=Penaeus vannamei TaxID=6689 RepID=UPI00387F4FD5
MWGPENTSGGTGSSAGSSTASSVLSTGGSSISAASTGALKNGIGLAWAVSGSSGKGTAAGVTTGMGSSSISMANVLDFLLTATQLYRVAAATTNKCRPPQIRASGKAAKGSASPADDVPGLRGSSSLTPITTTSSTSSSSSSSSTTPALPSASQTWARLLANPCANSPEQTLALLQVLLQDGLLDSILPYMVSSLNLTTTPALTPSHPAPPAITRSRTPTPTPSSKAGGKSHRSPTRDFAKDAARRSPTPTLASAPPSSPAALAAPSASASASSLASPSAATSLASPSTLAAKEEHRPPTAPPSFRGLPDRSPGIVIHVCDEARGLRQDFTCPRDLLIHHIGYFADVTAGQRLEDVDISVHCDVSIFEWLLRWVKRGQTEDHVPPTLEPKTAVSILISADFLKMAPLVEEVLQYVHDNINLILEAQVNLSCLSDAILTRLAYLFTHWELESLRDRRDRIQNKLYAKFLQGLCEAYPSPARGIFKTASTLYRCTECGNLVTRGVERLVACVPANTCITTTGQVYYTHSRDATWSLTEHVRQLKTDLKTWRLVYWRLWGQVHFLPCSTCGAVFPGSEMKFCRHHRLDAASSDVDLLLASDTYPCCGARALKFSPLPVRNGCLASDHTVQLSQGESDIWGPIPLIYDDLLTFQLLVCIDPPYQLTPESKNVLWTGVPLVPPNKAERSFLDRSWLAHFSHGERDSHAAVRPGLPENTAAAATTGVNLGVGTGVSSESSSDEEEGGGRPGLTPRLRANLMRRANRARRSVNCEVMAEPSLRWDSGRSTRHNQDAQREKETRLLRDLTSWLTLAAPNAHDSSHGSHKGHRGRPDRRRECANGPDPGVYYRLESEFRERHGSHGHGHSGGGGTFRAKVQAISRIKMRLRHRAAFSASR